MSDISQVAFAVGVLGILLVIVFCLMINGLDGLHQRVKKLEDAQATAKHDAWEEGFTAHVNEDASQRLNPRHPITRDNPYGGGR